MSTLEEIKVAIESLPAREFSRLRQWIQEKDWESWDQRIVTDTQSGKLDFLIAEALDEKAKGKLQEL